MFYFSFFLNFKLKFVIVILNISFQNMEYNWRSGQFLLQRINCRSENSKGVYCLQYDDDKIISGLRDNTIKIWDRNNLQNPKVCKYE